MANRRPYLAGVLRELLIPFFLGRDARKRESELLFALHWPRSNCSRGLGGRFWVEVHAISPNPAPPALRTAARIA